MIYASRGGVLHSAVRVVMEPALRLIQGNAHQGRSCPVIRGVAAQNANELGEQSRVIVGKALDADRLAPRRRPD